MVTRTVKFNDARPDTDRGHGVTVERLKKVQGAMADAIAEQRAGRIKRHGGSVEKRRIRREMLAGPIPYLVELGAVAGREHPEVMTALRFAPTGKSYLTHRTAARGLQAAAIANKELLSQYGLSEAIMDVFGQLLDQYDSAMQDADEGRAAHKSATAVLDTLGAEALRLVRLLDARNQYRFKGDPDGLSDWLDASTILGRRQGQDSAVSTPEPSPAPGQSGTPGSTQGNTQAQGGTPVAAGDVRPAA